MEKKFLAVGFVVWLVLVFLMAWPSIPCFLSVECMTDLAEEYGNAYVAGNVVGNIIIILILSYAASWIWKRVRGKTAQGEPGER